MIMMMIVMTMMIMVTVKYGNDKWFPTALV